MAQQSFDAFLKRILESAMVYSELPTDGEIETSEHRIGRSGAAAAADASNRTKKKKKKKKKI
jgi:hypothetical protein